MKLIFSQSRNIIKFIEKPLKDHYLWISLNTSI